MQFEVELVTVRARVRARVQALQQVQLEFAPEEPQHSFPKVPELALLQHAEKKLSVLQNHLGVPQLALVEPLAQL